LIKPYGSDGDSFYTNDIDSVQTRRAQMAYFFTKVIGNLEENEINTVRAFIYGLIDILIGKVLQPIE